MTRDEQWLLEEKYGGKGTPEYEIDKDRLANDEPLGYIIGYQPFLGLKIYLDSKPLIPRPETEWWAEQLLDDIVGRETLGKKMGVRLGQAARSDPIFLPSDERPLRILDLCTGSGAIGCAALAKLPNAHVYFGEIDPEHEMTIQKNIRENNLDVSHSDIRIGNLFEPFSDLKFDIIAANPPYIPDDRVLPASVADYEPARALFSGTDGLDIIRRIATELGKHLTPNGVAWIECDSAHTEAAQKLFEDQDLSAMISTDQYGKPRIIVVSSL